MVMAPSINWDLCDSVFLDLNTTWYTSQPRFSTCFRNTLLVWTPACVLLLALAIESITLRRARQFGKEAIPWNLFNGARILLVLILVISQFLEFSSFINYIFIPERQTELQLSDSELYDTDQDATQTTQTFWIAPKALVLSTLMAPIIRLVSYSSLGLIYLFQRRSGIHTSGPIWLYLLTAVTCGLINYYSVIVSIGESPLTTIQRYVDYAHFPILLAIFFFECHGDSLKLDEEHSEAEPSENRPTCPEMSASFCSKITFWWYNKFLWQGYKCRLGLNDLWQTPPRDKSCELTPIFRQAWVQRCAPSAGTTKATYRLASGELRPANNMIHVLFGIFWPKLLLAVCLMLAQNSLKYLEPMILKNILAFMSLPQDPYWHGVLFAILLLLVPTIKGTILNIYFKLNLLVGLNMKTILVGAIYRKALLLSGNSRQKSTSGEIVNLMAVDAQRFRDLLSYLNTIWSVPLEITLAIFLLYRELGVSVFAGIFCMALVLPANAYLAKKVKHNEGKSMETKDDRVKQINEVLGGIKVIKLYAWENSFIANICRSRERELAIMKRIFTLEAFAWFLWDCCPIMVACVTFAVYLNVDSANVLDAGKAFVSISLFNMLQNPLRSMPSSVTALVLALVSARRINRFLNSNELIQYVTRNEELDAIAIEGGTLTWMTNDNDNDDGNDDKVGDDRDSARHRDGPNRYILQDIDLHVKPGSFVAIVGQVASGKSSLLSAILGEMHRISGRFNICKSMSLAYVPQQAWIQNMTVRDNILFGSEYEESRYKRVLAACSLQADLETLPGGDLAEIGERGINLSGGQKQRVSLARACYLDSDIYLLDDPLSALDSHVAKHVYDEVLSSQTGLLRNKTRVFATNSLFVLPHVDHIVALKNGKVVESGSYRELANDPTSYLADIMHQYSSSQKDTGVSGDAPDRVPATCASQTPTELTGDSKATLPSSQPPSSKSHAGKLIDDEKLETGSVNFGMYLNYLRAVSWKWVLALAVPLVLSNALDVATNLWLSIWVSDADDPVRSRDSGLRTLRLSVYSLFGALQCFLVLTQALALCRGAVRAAKIIHHGLLQRIMHSPMTFFNTTPVGRVVNRFSKDIDVVDSNLPITFQYWTSHLLEVLSTIFVICYSFPTFLIILIPLAIVYLIVQRVFTATQSQLRRLESITRSPIYSNFNETLAGASTIRAYDCVDRFVQSSDDLVDGNQICAYTNIIAIRWLSLRLLILGNLITFVAALFSVYYKGTVSAGVTGLTLSYCLNITFSLSWLVRQSSDLETNIVSVERIWEYLQNEQEDRWVKEESRPPAGWPSDGAITIQRFSARYREGLDLALSEISIRIEPGEKIGIVGRTGSGKSSLSLGLFRLLEPASGAILIDGQNLASLGLHDIRSKLTIIPQDPLLFSGTLRFNLDPLRLHSDWDIWHALEQANMKPYVSSFSDKLDYKVCENGENFSVGQRQLICLARAILRKSKILVLDEATASVDLETDTLVQKTIREIFSDCTIITIAHRLHTILDSDRILVLDSGQVRELDSPASLIEDENSAFASLVREAGLDTSDIVTQRRRKDL